MKQSNCHARSRNKRRKHQMRLRLESFWRRVIKNRNNKRMEALQPKGRTIMGDATSQAVLCREASYFDHGFVMKINQRQKRKRALQSDVARKKAGLKKR
jgi:hypothetical protein